MRIKIGLGNSVTVAFNVTAKTLAFTGAYNFDLYETGISVWNTTRSAWMIVGQIPGTETPIKTIVNVAGLPVQTLTLSSIPAAAANADVLVITCECPDDVAIYNATVSHV